MAEVWSTVIKSCDQYRLGEGARKEYPSMPMDMRTKVWTLEFYFQTLNGNGLIYFAYGQTRFVFYLSHDSKGSVPRVNS